MAEQDTQKTEKNEQRFAIQRIYVKDISFEAPSTPAIFKEEWKPEMHLDIHTGFDKLEDDAFDVALTLTVTVKNKEATAFVVEVKQAGIFSIENFPDDQLKHTLGSFCPSVLYPYAREAVTDTVTRGGFPQLILAPVNFEALYQQHQQQQAEKAKSGQDGAAA